MAGVRKQNEQSQWTRVRNICLLILFDLGAVALIKNLIIPYLREIGANPWEVGVLDSVYSFIQLVSGPAMGSVSDHVPRGLVMMSSSCGSALGYSILIFTSNFWCFTASRVFVGVIRQFSTVSKAALCSVTTRENRTTAISYLYVARSIAFSGGAAIGGLLAEKYGIRTVFSIACGLFLGNAILVHVVMQDIDSDEASKVKDSETREQQQTHFSSAIDMVKNMSIQSALTSASSSIHRILHLAPEVRNLMIFRFVIGFSDKLSRKGLPFLLEFGRFGFGLKDKGYIMGYISFVGACTQALGVDFVIKRATEENLMLTSAIIMGVAQMTMIYGEHTVAMYCSLTVIAMASSVLKVCQQSLISQAAGRQRCGEVLGVADSVSSLSEVGVPMVIGVLMQHVSPFAPSVVAGVLGVGAGVGWLVAKPRVLAQKRE
eukprot:m.221181 g.221181  ORF g.221181 m.221181 type:complete len:431 (-) comp19181_c1_seq3:99-1391(-)